MSVNLILKSYFLKLISNHKTRPLSFNESPRFLILMNKILAIWLLLKFLNWFHCISKKIC